MPLIGGILADKFGYGKMVTTGIVIMFAGYVLLAIPMATNIGLYSMFGALALIALGTGLFKGNLQVMVGNLYDAPEYSAKRDTAFSLFYMAITIPIPILRGADGSFPFFANEPNTASDTGVRATTKKGLNCWKI